MKIFFDLKFNNILEKNLSRSEQEPKKEQTLQFQNPDPKQNIVLKKSFFYRPPTWASLVIIGLIIFSLVFSSLAIKTQSQIKDCQEIFTKIKDEFDLQDSECDLHIVFVSNNDLKIESLKEKQRLFLARKFLYETKKQKSTEEQEVYNTLSIFPEFQDLDLILAEIQKDLQEKLSYEEKVIILKNLKNAQSNEVKKRKNQFRKEINQTRTLVSQVGIDENKKKEFELFEQESLNLLESEIEDTTKASKVVNLDTQIKYWNKELNTRLAKVDIPPSNPVLPLEEEKELLSKIKFVTEKQTQINQSQIDCKMMKCLSITFDDGPMKDNTDRVLNYLKERNVQATFYVIGNKIRANEDLLLRMQAEGHEVANHTWTHSNLTAISLDQAKEEIRLTSEEIKRVTGVLPFTYRPPYGAINEQLIKEIALPAVKWAVDPKDWKDRNADLVARRVINSVKPNQIILLHDIHSSSVDSVPWILDTLIAEGYVFVPINKILGYQDNPEKIPKGVVY